VNARTLPVCPVHKTNTINRFGRPGLLERLMGERARRVAKAMEVMNATPSAETASSQESTAEVTEPSEAEPDAR
jgi:hypothetical protein